MGSELNKYNDDHEDCNYDGDHEDCDYDDDDYEDCDYDKDHGHSEDNKKNSMAVTIGWIAGIFLVIVAAIILGYFVYKRFIQAKLGQNAVKYSSKDKTKKSG